jgi:hypothetical protein
MPVFIGILNSRWTFVYLTLRTTGTGQGRKTLGASVKMQTLIFQTQVDRFSKRHWRIFSPYFYLYTILLALPLFNIHGDKFIYAIWWTLIGFILLNMYLSSRKWTLREVTLITLINDHFHIDIIEKDLTKNYIIHINNIKTNTKSTITNRPKVFTLTIFDKDNIILQLYSGGQRQKENDLKEIARQIEKTKNAST